MFRFGKTTTRETRGTKLIGNFNPDKYVFHLLLVLTLSFMVLYTIGTSVPAWYVLQERVHNVSTCSSMDKYVEPHVRRNWQHGESELLLSASLWFINVRLSHNEIVYSRFVPFISIDENNFLEEDRNGMLVESVFPKCLSTIFTLTFLGLGAAFACKASNRPSHLIYYGLSSSMITAAITSWISITIVSSEKFLLSMAYDFCVNRGVLKTSFLLQMISGSTGIISFVFACILIHLSILMNQKILEEKNNQDEEAAVNLMDNLPKVFSNVKEADVAWEKNVIQP